MENYTCKYGLYNIIDISYNYYVDNILNSSNVFVKLEEYDGNTKEEKYKNYKKLRYYFRAIIDIALPINYVSDNNKIINFPICDYTDEQQEDAYKILDNIINVQLPKYSVNGSIPLITDIINHMITVPRFVKNTITSFNTNHQFYKRIRSKVRGYCLSTNVKKDPNFIRKITPSICACMELTPDNYCNTTQCSKMATNNMFSEKNEPSTPVFYDLDYKPECPIVCLKYLDIQPNSVQLQNIVQKCGNQTSNITLNENKNPLSQHRGMKLTQQEQSWVAVIVILVMAIITGVIVTIIWGRALSSNGISIENNPHY